MIRRSVIAGVLLATTALSGVSHAQDNIGNDGIYVRIGAGASWLDNWDQDITHAPASFRCLAIGCNPDKLTTNHGGGFIAGGALGFDYADGIRTELEYRYASTDIDSVVASEGGFELSPTFLSGNTKAHFVLSNFYFDWTNDSKFTPFIGAGVGGAFVETETGDHDAALAYQGRVGISYDLGGGMSFDSEYIFLRTNKLVFGPNDDGLVLDSNESRLDGDRYQSSSVMASFRKLF